VNRYKRGPGPKTHKMDSLPRDLQLLVIKKFDMDTRIKTGIIEKLKVPESLMKTLEKLQPPRLDRRDGYIYTIKTYRLGRST
jgi:hypothetical protein